MADKASREVSDFSSAGFISEARKQTGLQDFGDERFVDALDRQLRRVQQELTFKPGGRDNYRATINRLLVNRLLMQEDLERHPEILQQEIVKPIIILGLPRTGTTKLQRMISAAPNVQKLAMWRMLNPAPFRDAVPGAPDPRITAIVAGGVGSEVMSEAEALQAAHHMGLTEVEEEVILFDFMLDVSVAGLCSYMPLFFHSEWLEDAREREVDRNAYAYLRNQLQYLQWQDDNAQDRPWIMKAPSHTPHLKALYETFPDATFVQCHRHPNSVVPSACKLMTALWGLNVELDEKQVGLEMYDWLRKGMQRFMHARRELKLDDRIIDVKYDDIRNRIVPVIEAIFARNGRVLNEEDRVAMLAWEQENEQGKHGKHHYDLADYHLDEAKIGSNFEEYIERFSCYF